MSVLSELRISDREDGIRAGDRWIAGTREIESIDPATGGILGRVGIGGAEEMSLAIDAAAGIFPRWRDLPAPHRGDYVRRIGDALRGHKGALGELVALESGKIRAEGEGEVQEMIDIAEFAVGLSRSVGGATIPSERPEHHMMEQWHPLGPVGVISAFNFPVAVWSWNALVAAACGDTIVWKPSEKTPLTAIAVQKIVDDIMVPEGWAGVFNLVCGELEAGQALAADPRLPLVSATGSCRMGKAVARTVAGRMGRYLLELGGNNALIVLDDADQELALRGVLFGALGTAGQRCTSTRRVLIHRSIAKGFTERLLDAYPTVKIGNPLEAGTLVGPLIDEAAVVSYERAIERIRAEGGDILCGGRRIEGPGNFVEPTLVRASPDLPIIQDETFAPILYLIEIDDLDDGIRINNSVRQGLSSAIFTSSVRSSGRFLSNAGSDCGIANVNIGTSGAEVGAAFGGEKETGGGREAGSDSWKAYMRRQTCTVNYGAELPLAQGIQFDT